MTMLMHPQQRVAAMRGEDRRQDVLFSYVSITVRCEPAV